VVEIIVKVKVELEREETPLLLWVEEHGKEKEDKDLQKVHQVMVEIIIHLQQVKQVEVLEEMIHQEVVVKEVAAAAVLVK
jgi:hypothetical protein